MHEQQFQTNYGKVKVINNSNVQLRLKEHLKIAQTRSKKNIFYRPPKGGLFFQERLEEGPSR